MRVQLLSFEGCPNRDAARAALTDAMAREGIDASIEELDVNASTTPEELRAWGSPTILIDGDDVGGASEPTGPSCRVYRTASGDATGAPDVDAIRAALRRAIAAT